MHDVDPVEEVQAELALRHQFGEVGVGGEDQPCAQRDELVAAKSAELALLQDAEELDLGREAELADLVEHQGAVAGLLEIAFAHAAVPVKAPFSWPKSSASMRVSGIAPQETATKGCLAREPRL